MYIKVLAIVGSHTLNHLIRANDIRLIRDYVDHYLKTFFASTNQYFYLDRCYAYTRIFLDALFVRHIENRWTSFAVGSLRCIVGVTRGKKRNFVVKRGYQAVAFSKHPQAWKIILTSCLQRVLLFFFQLESCQWIEEVIMTHLKRFFKKLEQCTWP